MIRPDDEFSWLEDSMRGLLPTFRWSGLSGRQVDLGQFSIVDLVPVEPGHFHVVFGSMSGQSSGEVPAIFSIPVALDPAPRPGVPGFTTSEPGGASVHVHLPMQDGSFWHQFLARTFLEPMAGDGFHVERKDESFDDFSRLLAGKARDVRVSILGAGDTTNIVMKVADCKDPRLAFVVKWYPRLSFNPAAIIGDALRSGGFTRHAKLLGTCELAAGRVQTIVSTVMGPDRASRMFTCCREAGIPVQAMFPVIHVFTFVNGDSDGGFPFWLSARATARAPETPVDISALDGPVGNASDCVASFHACLATLPLPGSAAASMATTSRRNRLEAKLATITRLIEAGAPPGLALPGSWQDVVAAALGRVDVPALRRGIAGMLNPVKGTQLVHQDLHLAQFMIDGDGEYIILDLEGDPQVPWEERLAPCSVEKDLAAMTRSLSYIKIAAFADAVGGHVKAVPDVALPLLFILDPSSTPSIDDMVSGTIKVLDEWELAASMRLLSGYERYHPVDKEILLSFMTARAIEEVHYEFTFRPEKVLVPLAGMIALLDRAAF